MVELKKPGMKLIYPNRAGMDIAKDFDYLTLRLMKLARGRSGV